MPMKDLSPCVTSPLAIVKVAKEIDATKKERRGMCREERTLRDGREEKEEEESEGAEGGEKYLYAGGSECWPLTPNQEGQAPVPCEMTRYWRGILPYCVGALPISPDRRNFFFPDDRQLGFLGSERIEVLL